MIKKTIITILSLLSIISCSEKLNSQNINDKGNNMNNNTVIPENVQYAYFSSGCFWGTEYWFEKSKGVISVAAEIPSPSFPMSHVIGGQTVITIMPETIMAPIGIRIMSSFVLPAKRRHTSTVAIEVTYAPIGLPMPTAIVTSGNQPTAFAPIIPAAIELNNVSLSALSI